MKLKRFLKEWSVVIAIQILVSVMLVASPIWFPFQLGQTEGTSMLPTLSAGRIILLQTLMFDRAHIANGTIISYVYDGNRSILHRIIVVGPGYYICQGDNNCLPDPWYVLADDVFGVYVLTFW